MKTRNASPRPRAPLAATIAASLSLASSSFGVAPWGTPQMQPGIAIVTCIAPDTDALGNPVPSSVAYTCGLLDLRNPTAPLYGINGPAAPLWNPPMSHETSWTADNLGMLFGSEIDADGDMYVAAGGLYPAAFMGSFHRRYGNLGGGATSLAAAGTIYKLDRMTGAPSVFSVLPQQATNLGAGFTSGPGVGNVAYDADFDQFFATNLEDGKIYRIPAAGGAPIGTTFDPLTADNGAPGMPPISERLWGICVHAKKVYYAVWNTGDPTDPGKIRRVDLDPTGDILPGTDVEILTVPGSTTMGTDWNAVQAPVGDIEISADGKTMILAQRTQRDWGGYVATANHAGKVFIARLTGATWATTNTLESGNSWGHGETYGGTDFGMEAGTQEQVIWATSADLAGAPGPHGLQGTRVTDFPVVSAIVPNCFKVPYDPGYTTSGPDFKGIGGDVDIMQELRCTQVAVKEVRCPTEPGLPYDVDITLTNHTGKTVKYLFFTPCPTGDLPAGAITGQPTPSGIITFPGTGLADGATVNQTIGLPAPAAGGKFCFRLTLLDSTGANCCTEKFCVDLPACDCVEIIGQTITCEPTTSGLVKYTLDLTIRNRTNFGPTPFGFAQVTFLPPGGFAPPIVAPSPNPIPPGGTGVVHTCYYGLPGTLCLNFVVHDAALELCCALENFCIELPECPPHDPGHPDTCKLEERVACCPDAAGGAPHATAHFTICNNSTVPRTYTWNATSSLVPPCTVVLPPGAFTPSSGTIGPVPPGGCVTIPIQIRCDGFNPGGCAAFEICASFDPAVPPVCCRSMVYRPLPGEVVVKSDGAVPAIAAGDTTTASFTLDNPGTEPILASLLLVDESGILALGRDGSPGSTPLRISIPLAAGASVPLTLDLWRLDDGHRAPDFTSIVVYQEGQGLTRLTDMPVRLIASTAGAPVFAIKSIELSDNPSPLVTLTVPTQLGKTYRVQESGDLVNWINAACSVLNTEVNPDGTFDGTGGDVRCGVPCFVTEPRRFYKVIETP